MEERNEESVCDMRSAISVYDSCDRRATSQECPSHVLSLMSHVYLACRIVTTHASDTFRTPLEYIALDALSAFGAQCVCARFTARIAAAPRSRIHAGVACQRSCILLPRTWCFPSPHSITHVGRPVRRAAGFGPAVGFDLQHHAGRYAPMWLRCGSRLLSAHLGLAWD